MAWKAKTFANTLMTVALVRNRGPFSDITRRFGCGGAHKPGPMPSLRPEGGYGSACVLDRFRPIEDTEIFSAA